MAPLVREDTETRGRDEDEDEEVASMERRRLYPRPRL